MGHPAGTKDVKTARARVGVAAFIPCDWGTFTSWSMRHSYTLQRVLLCLHTCSRSETAVLGLGFGSQVLALGRLVSVAQALNLVFAWTSLVLCPVRSSIPK